MLFSNFMQLYSNKKFYKIAVSVDGAPYKYYRENDTDSAIIECGSCVVSNVKYKYEDNPVRVLYVDLISLSKGYVSLRSIRVLLEIGTPIHIEDIKGRIVGVIENKDEYYCYDYANVIECYFINDIFFVRVFVD